MSKIYLIVHAFEQNDFVDKYGEQANDYRIVVGYFKTRDKAKRYLNVALGLGHDPEQDEDLWYDTKDSYYTIDVVDDLTTDLVIAQDKLLRD